MVIGAIPKNTEMRGLLTHLAAHLKPQSYLEVGVREGDSLRHVLAGYAVPRLTLCDTWGSESGGTGRGSHDHVAVQHSLTRQSTIEWLDGRSQELLPNIKGPFDLVTIDGSHSYEDALIDLNEGWRLARVMVVDDTTFTDVRAALEQFVCCHSPSQRFDFDGGYGVSVFARAGVDL